MFFSKCKYHRPERLGRRGLLFRLAFTPGLLARTRQWLGGARVGDVCSYYAVYTLERSRGSCDPAAPRR